MRTGVYGCERAAGLRCGGPSESASDSSSKLTAAVGEASFGFLGSGFSPSDDVRGFSTKCGPLAPAGCPSFGINGVPEPRDLFPSRPRRVPH